eukprot:UN07278
MEQNSNMQIQEIYRMRNELFQKDEHIRKLKTRLLSAYDQYIPTCNANTSPTLKVQSVNISRTPIPRNCTPTTELSPIPSLSYSNNYQHSHILMISSKKHKKTNSDGNPIKWSDNIQNITPAPIYVNDVEYVEDILPINIKRESMPNLNFGLPPITPFLNQINSNYDTPRSQSRNSLPSSSAGSTSYACSIKNSETPISNDVDANEDLNLKQ